MIGHTTDTDAHYLNYAAQRYELPLINFEFYDVKTIHAKQRKLSKGVSLDKMIEEFGLEFNGHFHRSDDDAYATMLVFKELCRIEGKDALTILNKYSSLKGYV